MNPIRKERTELLVGLFVFFGLAIMGSLIVQFGRFNDRFQEKYRIEVTFPDASGIDEGSPVTLAGQKIGFVALEPKLNEDFTGVTVVMDIFGDKRIPVGSRFTIGTSGLMGDTYIKVIMPADPKPEYMEAGAQVTGTTGSGLEDLQEDAGLVMADIRVALEDIRLAVQSLNTIFQKVDAGLLADENIENFKKTIADFRQTSENLNAASAKVDPLVVDARSTINEAKTAMTKAGETFDKAKDVIAKAEPAMDELQPTLTDLRATIQNANSALDRIQKGDGVAAALISDSGVRQDLESFVDKLDRYGILGYPKEKKSGGKLFGRDEEEASGNSSDRRGESRETKPATKETENEADDEEKGLLRKLFSRGKH